MCHRDIKPQNLLVRFSFNFYQFDFSVDHVMNQNKFSHSQQFDFIYIDKIDNNYIGVQLPTPFGGKTKTFYLTEGTDTTAL